MRVFYPMKLLQLIALWIVVYFLVHEKEICAIRKPQELLSAQEHGCHALLTAFVFEGRNTNYDYHTRNSDNFAGEERLHNLTEAESTPTPLNATEGLLNNATRRQKRESGETTEEGLANTTATTGISLSEANMRTEIITAVEEAEKTTIVMRGCIRIVERDVLAGDSSLDLYALRTPLAMLVVEVIFIVIQYVKVATSYDMPDQLTITLTNMVHGLLWLVSALALLIFRLGWLERWSGGFQPVYPSDYLTAEVICWLNVLFLLLETTLFPEVAYHDVVLEERGPGVYADVEEEVQRGCGTFKEQINSPLLGRDEE